MGRRCGGACPWPWLRRPAWQSPRRARRRSRERRRRVFCQRCCRRCSQFWRVADPVGLDRRLAAQAV
eukprot:4742199-Lingulodinium_polyedra.AAC.1